MITPGRLLSRFFVAASGALLCACGASQSTTAGTQGTTPAAVAVSGSVRALPADPLELLIGNPRAIIDVHVDRLRESPLFGRVRSLLENALCMSAADDDWLLGSTTRALLVSRDASAGTEWLLALIGSYSEADAQRLLAAVVQQQSAGAAAVASRIQLGRFAITTQAEFAVSMLDQRVMLLGAPAWLHSAVEAIERPGNTASASTLLRELAARVQCDQRSLCLLAAADSFAARQFQRALSQLGATDVGNALSAGPTALGVSATDTLGLAFVAQLPTADAATVALQGTKNWFGQAGLLIGLAGLPDVLRAVQARTTDNLLALDLNVSAGDLAQYEQRVLPLLDNVANDCHASAASISQ